MSDAARITIMISRNIQKRCREIQAKQIKNSQMSVSFSNVIGQVLTSGLKFTISGRQI